MALLVDFECLSTKISRSSCSDKSGKRRAAAVSFSLVLLWLVGSFLAERSMPSEKFGTSSVLSYIAWRKV